MNPRPSFRSLRPRSRTASVLPESRRQWVTSARFSAGLVGASADSTWEIDVQAAHQLDFWCQT